MKKIFLILFFIIGLILPANADIRPYYVKDINPESIGVYQAPKEITIYQKPNEKSKILLEAFWNSENFGCAKSSIEDLFLVYIPKKELAFLTVTDITDGWVEVIYNLKINCKGWIRQEDLRFFQWRNFYNVYGNKYGIYLFKDIPLSIKNIHSGTEENSQIISRLQNPLKIKLTVVKGNWALITAYDEDRTQKTGYLQWRNVKGYIFAFPSIH